MQGKLCRFCSDRAAASRLKNRNQPSVPGGGGSWLCAGPELAKITAGVVPAAAPKLSAVFFPVALGIFFAPRSHAAAKPGL